jgi:protein TonB
VNPDFFDGDEAGEDGNRWLKRAGIVLGLLVAVALVVAVIRNLMTDGGPRKKTVVQQISLLKPPPPPPPKPEQKPPEPQIKKEEVKLPEPDKPPDPQPAQAEPPPGPDLGVDSKGDGTGDSFGLVGKPGGKDITTIGGGGGGNRFTWYAGLVQGEIQKILARNAKLRGAEFKATVKIWMSGDGKVQRSELSSSTGNAETDELIRVALAEIPPLREMPPSDMPQPIRLRVTSRY